MNESLIFAIGLVAGLIAGLLFPKKRCKTWDSAKPYIYCGTTYTGLLILAKYDKDRPTPQNFYFADGIEPNDLKIGHVYSFEANGTQDKVYRVIATEWCQSGFAFAAGIDNPVIVEKSHIY